MEDLFRELSEAVLAGAVDRVHELTAQAVQGPALPRDILQKGLIAGMDVVGQRFKAGDMFVPEVLMSANAMHKGMDILRPLLSESDRSTAGRVLIGTVRGDLHDIGKNLVAMMLRGAGFEVRDLGVDVDPDAFVARAREFGPNIIGLSALLTTTMPEMRAVIEALEEADLRSQCHVLVGGAPVTAEFADSIGADGYAPDASSAVDLARKFCG